MADPALTCPHCQAPIAAQTRFCGSCGRAIPEGVDPAKPSHKHTMLGLDASAVKAAVEQARAPGPATPNAPPADVENAARPAATNKAMAKTMLGMVSPFAAAAPAPATVAAPSAQPTAAPPQAGRLAARTMLGMALPSTAVEAAAPAGTPAAAPREDSQGQRPAAAAAGGRTMLGVPLPTAPVAPGAPVPRVPRVPRVPHAAPAADGGKTQLDAFTQDSERPRASAGRGASREAERDTYRDTDDDTARTRRAARKKPSWLIAVIALPLLLGAAYFALRGGTSSAGVSAKVVAIDTGEALLFEVPAAPAGAKIRFGGLEKPLTAGRATFALAADSLRVGDNVVNADVEYPGGETRSTSITLAVPFRLWVDTAPLRDDKSAVDVIVTALPGTRVTLDGQEVKLDAEGRATRSYPIDVVSEAKTGMLEHVVHYRVQPPTGETIVDQLSTQIPVAMMQVDRPGRELVTDRDMVEIAGAAGKDATVTLDGTQVPVADGRFLYRFALPNVGQYKPRVVASAPGKAPMGITLDIRRVADLAQASKDFAADPDLTFVKLAPNPSIYRGQNIAVEGRVYATDRRGGESVIQMFARPCPSTQRCSVWVVDPAASEVTVDSWIRVLGVVEGEQQFRSEKNDVVTVPKIKARFVLPAKP